MMQENIYYFERPDNNLTLPEPTGKVEVHCVLRRPPKNPEVIDYFEHKDGERYCVLKKPYTIYDYRHKQGYERGESQRHSMKCPEVFFRHHFDISQFTPPDGLPSNGIFWVSILQNDQPESKDQYLERKEKEQEHNRLELGLKNGTLYRDDADDLYEVQTDELGNRFYFDFLGDSYYLFECVNIIRKSAEEPKQSVSEILAYAQPTNSKKKQSVAEILTSARKTDSHPKLTAHDAWILERPLEEATISTDSAGQRYWIQTKEFQGLVENVAKNVVKNLDKAPLKKRVWFCCETADLARLFPEIEFRVVNVAVVAREVIPVAGQAWVTLHENQQQYLERRAKEIVAGKIAYALNADSKKKPESIVIEMLFRSLASLQGKYRVTRSSRKPKRPMRQVRKHTIPPNPQWVMQFDIP